MELRAAISWCEMTPPMTSASLKRKRAPGFSTRNNSRRSASRPGMWQSTSLEKAASKEDLEKGSD